MPLGYRTVDKKLEIVPEDAALLRKIFEDYLRTGSVRELATSLDAQGIAPKTRVLKTGRLLAPKRFSMGALAYLLRNRMYVGEVVYQGDIHQGQHPALLERELFETVQTKLAQGKVERTETRSTTPPLLKGRLFDDHGFPMSPSHTNKRGVRYRYYVSQAVLQGHKDEAGSVTRVSGSDVEALAVQAIRREAQVSGDLSDRELVETHLDRIIVHSTSLKLHLRTAERSDLQDPPICRELSLPFASSRPRKKGITHAPAAQGLIDAKTRHDLLQAIAKANAWMDEVLTGKSTFEAIAVRDRLGSSYIRRLCSLAYLSPNIVRAIASGSAPDGLTVSRLTSALPLAWSDQEASLGIR